MTQFHRRDWLRAAELSLAGFSFSGWMPALANAAAAADGSRRRHCVLLWMPGGPSQMDTFDLKPEHKNGGPFKEIETSVPGLKISEHLPKLAAQAENLAIIRSLSTAEGDHSRGTYLMHTGHRPGGPITFPTMGSTISKALGSDDAELPNFISIAPFTALNNAAFGPGFLGPRHGPLTVGATNVFQQPQQQPAGGYARLGVDDLHSAGVSREQEDARLDLWSTLQTGFLKTHPTASPKAQHTVYERAVRMMRSEAAQAFELDEEPDKVRDSYGRGEFGQGCLMARRLIERGVPFIEIALRGTGGGLGWDTHQQNFQRVQQLSAELDAGWATLMSELKDRGLLESTTIVWLGEFGRTPTINPGGGRDHYPKAWTTVLAGGGIQGGQAYGRTSAGGDTVEEGQVDVPDVLATLCQAVGVDPRTQNISDLGRPIRIAEGQPIEAVLA
ncbi:MAG TPA: DUF1501 domain-containing protein [Pirellulaceae bacterium]|nr:DUF1501 domain-containing protein [Pirellulaceae bacterium]